MKKNDKTTEDRSFDIMYSLTIIAAIVGIVSLITIILINIIR